MSRALPAGVAAVPASAGDRRTGERFLALAAGSADPAIPGAGRDVQGDCRAFVVERAHGEFPFETQLREVARAEPGEAINLARNRAGCEGSDD